MFPDKARFSWFESHSQKIVECCRRTTALPGISDTPVSIYVPGGDDKYPSFWIRDFVMECRSGFIDVKTMETALRFFLVHQNGPEKRDLANGLRIDPWSIPEHINVPGVGVPDFHKAHANGAVFYPGSYSPTDNQGKGRYGLRPADDDIYEVVELTRLVVASLAQSQGVRFLQSKVNDISIIDRLNFGMMTMTVHPETGLCRNTPTDWAAANFHDALKPMGLISLTSCLRFRAAKTMAEFFDFLENRALAEPYLALAEQIAQSTVSKLIMSSGWLILGTELDRQPDVWATSMAVYYNLLRGEHARAACETMLKAYQDGTVAASGYLRHTPTTADVIPGKKVWEDDSGLGSPGYGTYQDGGYWPQPLGYYAFALAQVNDAAAKQIACEFIDHTRSLVDEGAPFEWFNPVIPLEKTPSLGRWYGPSAALPLEGFRRLSVTPQKTNR